MNSTRWNNWTIQALHCKLYSSQNNNRSYYMLHIDLKSLVTLDKTLIVRFEICNIEWKLYVRISMGLICTYMLDWREIRWLVCGFYQFRSVWLWYSQLTIYINKSHICCTKKHTIVGGWKVLLFEYHAYLI